MLLLLAACTEHSVIFDPKPGDSGDSGPTVDSGDSTGPGDSGDDTHAGDDTAPPYPDTCNAGTWSWGAHLTVDDADTSYLGEAGGDWAGGALGLPGDIDGDHVHDLVVGAPDNSEVALESGKIYLVTAGVRGTGQSLAGLPSFLGASEHMQLSQTASVGDLNHDGLADFVISPGYSWTDVYDQSVVLGTRTARLAGVDIGLADGAITETTGNVSSGFGAVPLGDFDGDGKDDVLLQDWGANSGQVWVVTDAGSGGTIPVPADASLFFHGDDRRLTVEPAGDLDGDGRADLLANTDDASKGTLVILGGATGSGASVSTIQAANVLGGARALGDVDGDGLADLGLSDGSFLLGGQTTWSGTLSHASVRLTTYLTLYDVTTVGDLDGDGLDEVAFLTGDSSGDPYRDLYIWRGRTTWPSSASISDADIHIDLGSSSEDVARPYHAQGADINGDGLKDLVLDFPYERVDGVGNAGKALVYLGRADWSPELTADDADFSLFGSVQFQSLSVAVDDLDRDGCADIVTSSYYHPTDTSNPSGEVFIFHGQNGGPDSRVR